MSERARILTSLLAMAAWLAVGCLLVRYCSRTVPTDENPIVELHIDTLWLHDTILTAGPVVVREEVREVPADVDTAAIISSYFTARTLTDSFRLRDMATVRITDTLFQNDIIGRAIDFDLAQLDVSYDIHEHRKGTPARLALTVGVQLGREQAALMGGVRFKRAELGVGYDFRLHAPSITLKYDIMQWQ